VNDPDAPDATQPPTGAAHPVAQDAQTLTRALRDLEQAGFTGQFRVLDQGRLQCLTCRNELDGREVAMESLHRLEGASDPADMLGVAAVMCPRCAARGTLVLNYGPDASLEESTLLLALRDARPLPE
jgi:hypothetical protein